MKSFVCRGKEWDGENESLPQSNYLGPEISWNAVVWNTVFEDLSKCKKTYRKKNTDPHSANKIPSLHILDQIVGHDIIKIILKCSMHILIDREYTLFLENDFSGIFWGFPNSHFYTTFALTNHNPILTSTLEVCAQKR